MNKLTSFPKEKLKILLLEGIHPTAVKIIKNAGYSHVDALPGSLSEKELLNCIGQYQM